MRVPVIAAALLLTGAFVAVPASQSSDQTSRASDSLERAFRPGGKIRLNLSAGEYRIEAGRDSRIRVAWVGKDSRPGRIRVRASIEGTDATVRTDRDTDDYRVTIEVPKLSDLHVRLSAGELTLKGVEGNKDVELHAGELGIDVGRADDYQRVDAAVWAGELHADPYRIVKEGLFRSFNWNGPGKYRLHVHLKAGELRLTSASGPSSAR